jgi:hypothetical protein
MSIQYRKVYVGISVIILALLSLTGCPALFDTSPPIASFEVTPASGAVVGDTIMLNGTGQTHIKINQGAVRAGFS